MRPFWIEQALFHDGALAPALQGDTTADVCIVGGGFTGLWTAIQSKQKNPQLDIVIIESDLCGAGASGRNGGCLLTWSTKFFTLKRLFGEDEAVRLVRASEDTVNHIERFVREHRIDAEFRRDGRSGVYGGYQNWQQRAGRFRSLGDGQIDFKTIFSKLTEYDFDGWAVMEWECCLKDAQTGAREGSEFIQRHIIPVSARAFDDFAAGSEVRG